MKIVTSQTMANIDKKAQEQYFLSDEILIENAGIKLFEKLCPYIKHRSEKILFIAGSGNNGGDALVMARQAYLHGYSVKILLLKKRLKPLADLQRKRAEALSIPIYNYEEDTSSIDSHFQQIDYVVDGLFGTGLSSSVHGSALNLIKLINRYSNTLTIFAIDTPSGVYDSMTHRDTAVHADYTFAVALYKWGHYTPSGRKFCGQLSSVPIGFPKTLLDNAEEKASLVDTENILSFSHRSQPSQHKGDRGHVALYGGSVGYHGAIQLASESALAMSAGLVSTSVPESIYPLLAGVNHSLMLHPSFDHFQMNKADAFCFGPGAVDFDEGNELVTKLLSTAKPVIIDASGINYIHGMKIDEKAKLILTPHPGELASLLNCSIQEVLDKPLDKMTEAGEKYNAVIVLKMHIVYIRSRDGLFSVVDGMNPALGCAGSGDVLAGAIAALTAGKYSLNEAAVLATYIHQKAGRACFRDNGYFTAQQLLPYMSQYLAEMERDETGN